MTKNQVRSRKQASKNNQQKALLMMGGGLVAVVALVIIVLTLSGGSAQAVSFPDIHGMSFTGDGAQLRVATHTGLVLYDDGDWSKPDLPINDYMGYSGTENGFYSSGHPGQGSSFVNPIGLVRSDDGGANVQAINFLGETDFHVMAASYYDDTVYVVNPAPNSLLDAGFHHSLDGGETWRPSAADGLSAGPIQIAVHPTEAGIVALATSGGLFVSRDFGDSFELVGDGSLVTTVGFDPNGERLIFGFNTLSFYDLESEQITPVPTAPTVDAEQAILYVAINPETDALAYATSDRDVYYSPDAGQTWQQIGADGESL